MNTISFSKVDFTDVAECVVGQEETLTITIIPTKIVGDQVTADVTAVAYAPVESDPVEEEVPVKTKSPISAIGVPGVKKTYA